MAIVKKWLFNDYSNVVDNMLHDISVFKQHKIIKEIENDADNPILHDLFSCPSMYFKSKLESDDSLKDLIKQYKFNIHKDKVKMFKSSTLHKQLRSLGYVKEDFENFNNKYKDLGDNSKSFKFIKNYIGSFITISYLGIEKTYLITGLSSGLLQYKKVQSYTDNYLMDFELEIHKGRDIINKEILEDCDIVVYKMKPNNKILKIFKDLYNIYEGSGKSTSSCELQLSSTGLPDITKLNLICNADSEILKCFDRKGIDNFYYNSRSTISDSSVFKKGVKYRLVSVRRYESDKEKTFKQMSNVIGRYSITIGLISTLKTNLNNYLEANNWEFINEKSVQDFNNKLWYKNMITRNQSIAKNIFKGLSERESIYKNYYKHVDYYELNNDCIILNSSLNRNYNFSEIENINLYLNTEFFNFKDKVTESFVLFDDFRYNIGYVDTINNNYGIFKDNSKKYMRQFILDKEFIDNTDVLEEGSYSEDVLSYISLYNYMNKDKITDLNFLKEDLLSEMLNGSNNGNRLKVFKR